MSARKHTPGPWTVDRVGAVVDSDGNQVANATGQAPMRGDPAIPVPDIQRANAQLIAAAPDYHSATDFLLRMAAEILRIDPHSIPKQLRDALPALVNAHCKANAP